MTDDNIQLHTVYIKRNIAVTFPSRHQPPTKLFKQIPVRLPIHHRLAFHASAFYGPVVGHVT